MLDLFEIVAFCLSLISVVEAESLSRKGERCEIHLAYFSMKEYLHQAKIPGFSGMEPSIGTTHACIAYISSIPGTVRDTPDQFPGSKARGENME